MSQHHSRQANTGTRFTTKPTTNTQLKGILTFFIDKHTQATEQRLQKLTFYAEYFHYQENGKRITTAEYSPFMYGMYSEDIRTALIELECDTKPDYLNGTIVTAYRNVTESINMEELNTDFLDKIFYETKHVQTEDLMNFTKNIPMYEKTDFGEPAEFNDRTVEPASN